MFCPNCGADLGGKKAVCRNCGKYIKDVLDESIAKNTAASQEETPKESGFHTYKEHLESDPVIERPRSNAFKYDPSGKQISEEERERIKKKEQKILTIKKILLPICIVFLIIQIAFFKQIEPHFPRLMYLIIGTTVFATALAKW